jgi:hypothetical protein
MDVQVPPIQADQFAQRIQSSEVGIGFNRTIRDGRAIGRDAKLSKQKPDPIKMESVAHRDAGMRMPLIEDLSGGVYTLIRGSASSRAEDFFGRDSFLDKIIAPHTRFGVMPVAAASTGGDDERRKAALFQTESVIESRLVDRRGRAVVFRRPHHHDGGSRPGLIRNRLGTDGAIKRAFKECPGRQSDEDSGVNPTMEMKASQPNNSLSASSEIGPWRKTRGRSPARSTTVEASSLPVDPPSRIKGKR